MVSGATAKIVSGCWARLRKRSSAACCSALALMLAAAPAVRAETIYVKSRRLEIPFQFDKAELQRLGAQQIQLYVSADQGGSWRLLDSVTPAEGKVLFEAPEEGEFWFSVRTRTASGLEYPTGPHTPDMKIVVDASAPTLHLEVDEPEPGRVRLQWRADDPAIDIDSLTLEFTDPLEPNWHDVAVRPQPQGQTTWTIAEAGRVQIRGTVADRSGNIAEADAEIQVSAYPDADVPAPDFSRPIAAQPKSEPKTPEESLDATAKAAANTPTELSPSDSAAAPRLASTLGNNAEPAPLAGLPQSQQPLSAQSPQSRQVPAESGQSQQAQGPLSKDVARPAQPHLVNSNQFRLSYQIDEIGPSGVGSVNLYITEDGGRKWFHYGADPDHRSPAEIKVPRDGEYGFSIRVANGLGVAAIPPQPGDAPEMSVSVDRVAPVLKLQSIERDPAQPQNGIIIKWNVQDRQLDPKPIALYYATHPTGPWQPIESWQPESGQYRWTVPADITQRIYFRVEARDLAGNVSRVDAEQPFLIDRLTPRARVTDVQTLHDVSQ